MWGVHRYLAEDRILCFELIARKGCNWTLQYVKNAIAITDVPETLPALIGQRRRWLNGTNAGYLYITAHLRTLVWHSKHSFGTKCVLTLQILMQDLQILVLALGPVQPKTRASVYAVRTL